MAANEIKNLMNAECLECGASSFQGHFITCSKYSVATDIKDKSRDTVSNPKHGHYYRFVSHLKKLDWYRFCELFDVLHPCAQHAGKKIVFAGQRGAKDIRKDIQEAIDTLNRWIEMIDEEGK